MPDVRRNSKLLLFDGMDFEEFLRMARLKETVFLALVMTCLSVGGIPSGMAQQIAPGGIEGLVRRSDTLAPIEGATVDLLILNDESLLQTALTDAQGRFNFRNVPFGEYLVKEHLDGYLASRIRRSTHLDRTTPVVSETRDLTPTAEISGRVLNADGSSAGKMLAIRALGEPPTFAHTNERGEYALIGLAPGEYRICAEFPLNDPTLGDVSSTPCYLDSDKPIAGIKLSVRAAQKRVLDLTFVGPPPRPSYSIAGRATGLFPEMLWRHVFAERQTGAKLEPSDFDNSGRRFNYCCIPEGTYDLWVAGTLEKLEKIYVGHKTIEVHDNIKDLEIAVGAGVNLRGRLTLNGRQPTPAQIQAMGCLDFHTDETLGGFSFNVSAERMSTRIQSGDISNLVRPEAATFMVETVPAGIYAVDACRSRGAYVADVRQAGKSLMNSGIVIGSQDPEPIEVLLRTDSAKVTGTVLNLIGAAAGSTVVLAPQSSRYDSRTLLNLSTAADKDGHFAFPAIPPGEYRISAWINNLSKVPVAERVRRYGKAGEIVKVAPGEPLDLRVTAIP